MKVGRLVDESYISNVKYLSRGKVPKRKTLPDMPDIRSFLDYVKSRFLNYDPSVLLVSAEESPNVKYEVGKTIYPSKTYYNV